MEERKVDGLNSVLEIRENDLKNISNEVIIHIWLKYIIIFIPRLLDYTCVFLYVALCVQREVGERNIIEK